MDSISSHPVPAGTRAITIPLHYNSSTSLHFNGQNSQRQAVHGHRPARVDRVDSDVGNASGSSLGSDWTSSPATPMRTTTQSRLMGHSSVASPSAAHRTGTEPNMPLGQRQRKDKQRACSDDLPPNSLPPLFSSPQSPLGPSMLSSSAYKSINLSTHLDPESNEPARLITYTKHSQGFTWNDELFLPSYLLGRHRYRGYNGGGARRRWLGDDGEDDLGEFEEEGERCPVTDIFVTDEEAAAMMP